MYNSKRIFEIDQYHPRVNGYEKSIMDEWEDLHSSKEDIILHHYTTPNGLKGIIENREIWSTDIESMNDTKEMKYGIEIINEEINVAEEEFESRLVKDALLSSIREIINKEKYNVFVTCFCRDGDLLSQWRGYADGGGGYSLKFRFNNDVFTKDMDGNLNKPILRKVIYDKNEQIEITQKLVQGICEICDTYPDLDKDNPDKEEIWMSVAQLVAKTLLDFAISFKHEGFREEKEWRLVRTVEKDDTNKNVSTFRVDGGLIVPYLKTELVEMNEDERNKFPIEGLMYGPSHNEERAERSLNLFINSTYATEPVIEAGDVEIQKPKVPFKPKSN
jgi:hypothetical protein